MKQITKTLALAFMAITGTIAVSAQSSTDFKPSGKVYGYAFGDYYYKMHNDSANRGSLQYSNMPETNNSFEFRRVYLGYEYNISERFTSDVLLSYEGNTLSDGQTRTVFLKSANMRWKGIWKGTDMLFGLQPTPAFSLLSEKLWGYRSIEKTIFDQRKAAGSSDLGIGIQATLGDSGNAGYNFLVANGSGTKIEGDIFKKFYADFWVKLLNKRLILDIYADFERTQMVPDFHKYKQAYKFTAIYTTKPVTFGVEAYAQTLHNYVGFADTTANTTDTSDAMAMGVSVWVRGTIIQDKLNFFARFDTYNPDMNYNNALVYTMGAAPVTDMFITAGVDFTPHKNVHIMPNIWYNGFSSRAKNASGKVKSDYDLVPRLTFYYIFK
jgi:hypothetical protein